MSLAREAVADSLGTSQRESFHISFTLHIYYIIFFYKNQKRFLNPKEQRLRLILGLRSGLVSSHPIAT